MMHHAGLRPQAGRLRVRVWTSELMIFFIEEDSTWHLAACDPDSQLSPTYVRRREVVYAAINHDKRSLCSGISLSSRDPPHIMSSSCQVASEEARKLSSVKVLLKVCTSPTSIMKAAVHFQYTPTGEKDPMCSCVKSKNPKQRAMLDGKRPSAQFGRWCLPSDSRASGKITQDLTINEDQSRQAQRDFRICRISECFEQHLRPCGDHNEDAVALGFRNSVEHVRYHYFREEHTSVSRRFCVIH